MATNTDIKRVLKRYQSSAEKGLHGPSSYMSKESSDVNRKVLTNSSGCSSSSGSTHDKAQVHFKKVWASSLNPQQTPLCCVTSEQQTLPSSKCHPDDLHLSSLKGYHHTLYTTSYHHHPSVGGGGGGGGKSHQIYHHQKDDWDLKYHLQQQQQQQQQQRSSDGKVFHHQEDDDAFGLEKRASSGGSGSHPSSKCCDGDDTTGDNWVLEKHSIGHLHHGGGAGSSGDVVLSRPRSASNSHGGWADVGAFTPPSPYSPPSSLNFSSPPQMPFPLVMGPADEYGGKGEVLLEGNMVACFSVGGEKRLCFPQVLNASLKDFSLGQINAQNQALHIYLSYCSSRQLQCLKEDDVLPSTVKSCGLITFSDAHRLTHALLHANNARAVDPPKTLTLPYNSSTRQFVANSATTPMQLSVNSHSTNHHIPSIIVSHRCFGKCRGWVYLSLYDHPEAACIQCCECRAFYSPAQFVCHAHRSLENRTCHWGFDPANWRIYLQLASDQPLQPVGSSLPHTATLPEVYLQQFKIKFGPSRQRQAPEARNQLQHHPQQQQQRRNTSSPGPSVLSSSSSRPSSRTNPTPTSYSTSTNVITLDTAPRPSSAPHDDTVTTVSSLGGASGCDGEVGGGCLSTLAVLSKDGNAFAPPPAALVRESMPAPLPPKLQSKGPPVLIDPGRVVPLSQYEKFRNCQPNVTLAPRLQKSRDSEKEVVTDLSTGVSSSLLVPSCKDTGAGQSFVQGKSSLERKDAKDLGGGAERPTLDSSSKYERENVVLRTVGGETKGYTISLCQTYKPQTGGKHQHSSLNTSTSEAKRYTSPSGPSSSGFKNITDQRGCPILSNELKLLSVDRSVVPKDLQIIKLDPNVRSERHVVPSCRSSGSGQCLVSKSLRMLKVEPSSGTEIRPKQEILEEDSLSSFRSSVARVSLEAPTERRLSNSSEPSIKQERLYLDEGSSSSGWPSGNSQDPWRHNRAPGPSFSSRRASHGGGTHEEECEVSAEDQNIRAASSYCGEREDIARRKLPGSADCQTSVSFFSSSASSSTTSKRSGVVTSDSVCCCVSSGNSNSKHNNVIKSSNSKDASCSNSSSNNYHGTNNLKQRAQGDVVASCSRDIKHEPTHCTDTTHLDDGATQDLLTCTSASSRACHRSAINSSASVTACRGTADCRGSAVQGGGSFQVRSNNERWNSLEAVPEAASAVSEAEAILQRWEDKDSAFRVAALLRSLVPLCAPGSGTHRRHQLSPGSVGQQGSASPRSENEESFKGGSPLTAESEDSEAAQHTSGEKERHFCNEDGASPRQQQRDKSTENRETEDCSPYRCDEVDDNKNNSNKCTHYSNISDMCSRKSSLPGQLTIESCKQREKKSQDMHCAKSSAASGAKEPRDNSSSSGSVPRDPVPAFQNAPHVAQGKLDDCMQSPTRDKISPNHPTKVGSPPDRSGGIGARSPSRGTGSYASNVAVKRQHPDATEEVPNQALETKVRNLESELARVMAELSCYKKIKTEPVDDVSGSMMTATATSVRDYTDRHHRKDRQRRHHLSTKEERRRERMRQRELAAMADRDSRQQQQHAGEGDSRSYCTRPRDEAGEGGSLDESGPHKSRERWRSRSSSSHRPDHATEGGRGEHSGVDPIRSEGEDQESKRSRTEHSDNGGHSEGERDSRQAKGENRNGVKATCSVSISFSSSSSGESPQPESSSEETPKAGGSTNERQRDKHEESEGGDALMKHEGSTDALRREPPKP